MTSEEYLRRRQWDAFCLVAEHELLDMDYWDPRCGRPPWNNCRGARWVIGRPNSNIGRCEVLAGILGSLVVHGDFDLVRYAYGPRTALARLEWLAHHGGDFAYVAEKAAIGSASSSYEYDARVAKHDIEQHLLDEEQQETRATLEEALERVDEEHALREFLAERDRGENFWEWTIGAVVRWEVIIGHAVVNKTAALLEAARVTE